MLESLGLPVSNEQLNVIALMEREYLRDEIIPLIKQELQPLVEKMRNRFDLEITYSRTEGLDIQLTEQAKQSRSLFPNEDVKGYRKKKYIIRVTFPDNLVSFHNIVSNTFVDVIKYAGAKNVEQLGLTLLGENIISTSLLENERYAQSQQEIEPGLYVNTYCDTERKLDLLKTINRELNLNLIVEKVMLD